MNYIEIQQKLCNIIDKIIQIRKDYNSETLIIDLLRDSLEYAELICAIQEEFKIQFDEDTLFEPDISIQDVILIIWDMTNKQGLEKASQQDYSNHPWFNNKEIKPF